MFFFSAAHIFLKMYPPRKWAFLAFEHQCSWKMQDAPEDSNYLTFPGQPAPTTHLPPTTYHPPPTTYRSWNEPMRLRRFRRRRMPWRVMRRRKNCLVFGDPKGFPWRFGKWEHISIWGTMILPRFWKYLLRKYIKVPQLPKSWYRKFW